MTSIKMKSAQAATDIAMQVISFRDTEYEGVAEVLVQREVPTMPSIAGMAPPRATIGIATQMATKIQFHQGIG